MNWKKLINTMVSFVNPVNDWEDKHPFKVMMIVAVIVIWSIKVIVGLHMKGVL